MLKNKAKHTSKYIAINLNYSIAFSISYPDSAYLAACRGVVDLLPVRMKGQKKRPQLLPEPLARKSERLRYSRKKNGQAPLKASYWKIREPKSFLICKKKKILPIQIGITAMKKTFRTLNAAPGFLLIMFPD